MNRQQFRIAYSNARKAARFMLDMHCQTKEFVESMHSTIRACPGFCFTRLHPDTLFWIGGERWRRTLACHRTLIECLRAEPAVRLPR